jgi:hypothetical protein
MSRYLWACRLSAVGATASALAIDSISHQWQM